MGIGSGSLDGNGNGMGRNLGIEWEMGMLVWEWEGMGTRNPLPLTSSVDLYISDIMYRTMETVRKPWLQQRPNETSRHRTR